MNEVTVPNNAALAAAAALKGSLQKTRASVPVTGQTGYAKFGKDGLWSFGADNEEIIPEDRVAVNPLSIKTGYSCWTDRPQAMRKKNEILGEVMYPLGADVPHVSTMAVKKDPETNETCEWKAQTSVTFRFVNGPHKDKQVSWSVTSVGGQTAMGNLIDQIMLRLDEDPATIVPVLSLSSDSYTHKQWGKTYTPVLKIVDWVGMDGPVAAVVPEKPVEEPKAVTGRSRSRAAEPEPARTPDVEEPDAVEAPAEEPVRRRRR